MSLGRLTRDLSQEVLVVAKHPLLRLELAGELVDLLLDRLRGCLDDFDRVGSNGSRHG